MSNATFTGKLGGYLQPNQGSGSWFTTRDHKRIGMMFLCWTMSALLLGLLFSILLTVKGLGGMGSDPHIIFQAMTFQRLILVFMVLVPAIPAILGHFLLPLQLGARNMALPLMSVWSLRFYILGLVLTLAAIFQGVAPVGWTLATPLSLTAEGGLTLLAFALGLMGVSWFLTGVNILVTVHHRRAPGMGFFGMPVLAWSLYLAAFMLVASGLILAIIVVYLAASRASGEGLFGLGSDPLLWQNYFWFVTHSAVYCALIPAIGVIGEVIAGVSRKAVAGYRTQVGAMMGLMAIGLVTWGVHLGGLGQDPATTFVVSVLSLLTVVPAALLAYNWLATLHRGAVACAPPTSFIVAFLLHAGIAGVMGLLLVNPAVGSYLGTTMFATIQLDYLMWGAVMSALLAGLNFWWPKMTGRMVNIPVGRFGGVLYIVGLNLAFVPQAILGTRGAPMDLGVLEAPVSGLAELSALGWLIMISGLSVVLGNLIGSLFADERAAANPWGAATLEWEAPSPPPSENFATRPQPGVPYGP